MASIFSAVVGVFRKTVLVVGVAGACILGTGEAGASCVTTVLVKFLLIFGLKMDKISKMLSYPKFFDKIEKKEDQDTKKFQNEIIELKKYFINKIFNPKYYEIGKVGRYKLNNRLNLNIVNDTHLTIQDILASINGLIKLYYNKEKSDDIDNLENRRVRSVGELIQTQFRFGLTRLERNLVEKMSICDPNLYKTRSLVNPKLVM